MPSTTATTTAVTGASGVDFEPLPADALVVDLGFLSLDLASLGVAPAAVGYPPSVLGSMVEGLDPAVAARLAAPVSAITDGFVVPIDALAALEPELILTTTFYATQFEVELESLAQVAPVFVIDAAATWSERLQILGDLFGLADEAANLVTAMEARVDDLDLSVESSGWSGATVSIVRLGVSEVGGDFEAFVAPSPPSSILAEVGLRQPAAQ